MPPPAQPGAVRLRGSRPLADSGSNQGDADLNFEREGCREVAAAVVGPLPLGGRVKPRKSDNLTWERADLGGDGTHPSESGRKKVAEQLLKFFKSDSTAKGWFVK